MDDNSQREPVVRGVGKGRTMSILGDVYRFLATGDETDGKYAMWEATISPGGGPPLHRHRLEEESFYVLEGQITFQIDGQTVVAGPGTFANMPVGSAHSFKNQTEQPARMIISVAPSGLELMFSEFGQQLEEGASEPKPVSQEEIAKLLEIAPRYGVEIL